MLLQRALVLLSIVLLIQLGAEARAQEPEQLREITIIIDPAQLTGARQAAVLKGLAGLTDVDEWRTIRVPEGGRLFAIVNEEYRFNDRQMASRNAIASLIADANALPDLHTLRAGESLRVPLLPLRPDADVSTSLTQLVDATTTQVVALAATETFVPAQQRSVVLPAEWGSTWVIRATPERVRQFLDAIGGEQAPEIGSVIYIGAPEAIAEVEFPEVSEIEGLQEPTDVRPPLFALPIDATKAGRLYIFDFFERRVVGDRPHGTMVLDVVKQVLSSYGASQLVSNVELVELDFYRDPGKASEEIERYISRFPSERTRRTLGVALRELRSMRRPPPGQYAVPVLYLQALYANRILSSQSAIVSSSFWTQFDGLAVIPPGYRPDSPVALVSAVLDLQNSTIENAPLREPLRTFFDRHSKYGMILVGAELSRGQFFGMSSVDGAGVTTIARGTGWSGEMIRPTDRGTSFSTPAIAAALLVAQAHWNSQNLPISAFEAKRRLLLAADIVPSYVGKFASAGVPRIDRLLLPPGAYAVRTNGTITGITIQKGSLSGRIAAGEPAYPFLLRRGDPGIRALSVVDGKVFVFADSRLRWFPIEITELEITIREGNETYTFRSLNQFLTRYKEIMLL